jgi:ATP/maltotriose-dependent transcriptional regulator MalT
VLGNAGFAHLDVAPRFDLANIREASIARVRDAKQLGGNRGMVEHDKAVGELLAKLKELGISKREFEILQLIAEGHTNKEIGEKLFVSTNTIKTHSSRLFVKLDATRRTQAVQKAKLLGLLP